MPAVISAISYYLPERLLGNEEYYARFPEARGTALEKVGVRERHIARKDETASDLAFAAAEKLFSEHGIDRASIDFLVLCINEPDYYTPTTACVLQERLKLNRHCGAFDYNLGCSGYVYGLGISKGMIESMGAKNVLFITTSVLSHTFHERDRSSWFIFGDGAAATLVTAGTGGRDIGPFSYGTDGKGHEKIIVRDGHARNPISEHSYDDITDEYGNTTSRANFHMDGTGVLLFTLKTVPAMVNDVIAKAGLEPADIDLFVFHQANVYLNETIRKKMNIPEEKFVHCMDRFGNTVASSIPIALYEAKLQGRLKPGMRVLLAGFGTGLSWASCIMQT
ncbi:MAG: 3-oxoacyl-acyl-carrier-protein synthase III [Bacteroidetes bacterium]|nr:MAG: 3-oxoacyl-acyl-carrier-protein synthase III [Bacteroidota bacterium]